MCIRDSSQTAFARELAGRVLAMVGLGNSRVVQTREPGEDEPLPEEMRGRLFDQNGRELMTYGEVLRAAGTVSYTHLQGLPGAFTGPSGQLLRAAPVPADL